MKNCKSILLLLCLWLSLSAIAVTGSGHVISEKRNVTDFRKLTINGPFKIECTNNPHSDYFILVEADDNLQQYITVLQTGESVYINLRPEVSIDKYKSLTLHIDSRNISSLTINAITTERSDILLAAVCPSTSIKITGSIPIAIITQVICHPVRHMRDSMGTLDAANEFVKLTALIDNRAETILTGDVEEADIISSRGGTIHAYDLHADLLRVRNTGASDMEVFGFHEFRLANSGTGHIRYSGPGAVTSIRENIKGSIVKVADITDYDSQPSETTTVKSILTGFNTDSLLAAMMGRDQRHRQIKGDTLRTAEDDSENFKCLKWYLSKYGYPRLFSSELQGMIPTLLMHIDNYMRFQEIDPYLITALKDGDITPNTYAYSYDRCLIASHKNPKYYYFLPDSDWDREYKPSASDKVVVNSYRKEIGLPEYPLLLNGKYF